MKWRGKKQRTRRQALQRAMMYLTVGEKIWRITVLFSIAGKRIQSAKIADLER
jgi:hypothetical protein